MGCFQSRPSDGSVKHKQQAREGRVKHYSKPKWTSDEPLSADQLKALREEFWDTSPHYGGSREIWSALKAACEADIDTARVILEAAGIIVSVEDMTVCYDERGFKYDLPNYVISAPTNLMK